MKAELLSSLIPFLRDGRDVHATRDVSFAKTNVRLGQTAYRKSPPNMPYMLRNHRLMEELEDFEESNESTERSWWIRMDHSELLGPASRRSLDSAVYQIFKDKDQGERRDFWLTDWFDNDGKQSPSSSSSTSSSEASQDSTSSSSSTDEAPRPGNPIPLPSNIDATHFSPSYVPPVGDIEQEFMVVSGGFTDTDWTSFPVWAFDLGETAINPYSNWRDLSGLGVGRAETTDKGKDRSDDTEHLLWPPGRVGHVSALFEGNLHIFGGMLWKEKTFVVEDAPYVWKAKVEHKLNPPNESLHNSSVLEWERIIPTVRYYKDLHDEDVSSNSSYSSSEDSPHHWQDMTLTRGECRGGHWAAGSALVFYGGLHVKHQLTGHHRDKPEDVALGDVWIYNYTSQTMEQVSPYPPPHSQRDEWGRYPVARTAHAATVVGNSLFVYGGMTSSAWSTTRGNADIGVWDELSDVWVFDLVEKKWSERYMTPALSRSYHTMVGWKDGSVGVFGGFRTARTISGEPIAFVFSDTLVSHPNDPTWWKAVMPHGEGGNIYDLSASNRLEHTAAVDKYGSMYVWGGRFKTVMQIHGMWSLDLFNADSTVDFEAAPPDGLEAYEAELEALHMLVAVMLLMSVFFTALYGTLRRQAMENEAGGGGNANGMGILGRRRGLSPETIDALPVKTYGEEESSPSAMESNTEGESEAGGLSDVALEEECCPICLVEYETGDELRLLPCNHEFHKICVDSWLENNTSCPACRHSLSNAVPDSEGGESEADGVWRVEQRVDPITVVPTVSLTQLLAGREIGWFRGEEDDTFSGSRHGSPSSNSEDAHVDDEDTEDTVGTWHRNFGFARYFSLPTLRSEQPNEETLGDTEMIEMGPNLRVV